MNNAIPADKIPSDKIPPRQMPPEPDYPLPHSESGVLALYNTASQTNAESFPVLQAFQEYIEAERAQSRKRITHLSIMFAVIMGVVVTGFLAAGILVLRNMSNMQTSLLEIAFKAREQAPPAAPAAPQQVIGHSPLLEESLAAMNRSTGELRDALQEKLADVSEVTGKVHQKITAQDSELSTLRDELALIRTSNENLRQEIAAAKDESAQALKAAQSPQASSSRKAERQAEPQTAQVQQTAQVKQPAQKPEAAQLQAPAQAEHAAGADNSAAVPLEPPPQARARVYPVATKEPPHELPADARERTAALPRGRTATTIPLNTRNGAIPWHIQLPD